MGKTKVIAFLGDDQWLYDKHNNIISGMLSGNEEFDVYEELEEKTPLKTIISLKQEGFTSDEIIEMKKEGLI